MNTENKYFIPFENGVESVLHVQWDMVTTTPLVIRNGEKAKFAQDPQEYTKSRGRKPELKWLSDSKAFAEIAEFNYVFILNGDHLECEYHIPASSIRGALRNRAICRMVEYENRDAFSLQKKSNDESTEEMEFEQSESLTDLENRIAKARAQLEQQKNRWYDILSLFGIAFNPAEDPDDPMTWSGRLRVSTDAFSAEGRLDYSGKQVPQSGGPQNASRSVAYRNPTDRTIQAAKSTGGGLHHWIELDPDTKFTIHLCIRNVRKSDIGLLRFWKQEIQKEMLTFGALQSIGRGKVKITGDIYKLFTSPSAPVADELIKIATKSHPAGDFDPLAEFWVGGKVDADALLSLFEE